MEKLVENGQVFLDGTLPKYAKEKMINKKVETLQEFEEKMGIDATVLFSALFNGCYVKDRQGHIHHVDIQSIGNVCLNVAQFTDTYDDFLFYADYGKIWSLHESDLNGQTQVFKDCYVKMVMKLKATEMFDVAGRLVILSSAEEEAVLHPAQANDHSKRSQCERELWRRVCKQRGLNENEDYKKYCSFSLKPIPKKSEPITFYY